MNTDEILDKVPEQTENTADSFSQDELKSGGDFTLRVRKIIRREFRKAGLVLLAILLAALCFVQWGLSPIVASFYYNPMEKLKYYDGEYYENIVSLDFAAYTELHHPLDIRSNVMVYNRGYGSYDIAIREGVWFSAADRKYGTIVGHIERGELFFYNRASMHEPSFGEPYTPDPEFVEAFEYAILDQRAYFTDEVGKLPEDSRNVYVIQFKEPMSIEESEQFAMRYLDSHTWQGVVTGATYNNVFGYTQSGAINYLSYVRYDHEKYPLLVTGDDGTGWGDIQTPEDVETHFTSMLKYMADRKQFVKMIDDPRDRDSYSRALEYVKENGMQIYCIVTWTSAKIILDVYEDPVVDYIAELL
ncbi:MAG: anti-sigma factor C-terminal domain-containing protein [Oscillospiraceae bacterium]|jgi:hypothetical protein|nr:anti-sigma factor C-terminal domain-containing protein [Oscillospiraceae bacterium]